MTKEEIINIIKFRTWLKISIMIGNDKTMNSYRTLDLINAFLSFNKYPKTFYIRDILSFLENNDNPELLDYMQIHCCNEWPIKEEDMKHAEHMFTYGLLAPFNNYEQKPIMTDLVDFPFRRYAKKTKFDMGLDLHAFYNDSFLGCEYYSMSIFENFVKNVNITYSSPLEYSLTPKEKTDDNLDCIIFEHIVSGEFCRYDEYCGSEKNQRIDNSSIEQAANTALCKFLRCLERRDKERKKAIKDNIRKYLYSKWNFRFKIEDDGDIFLYNYNYIADEEFYKNIFHKMIGKKSYRMKSYKKDFNFKMNVLEFETFVKGHREYISHDPETIKILIY